METPILSKLVHDLGLVLAMAGLVAVIFKWRGWPAIFGYILAGVLLGPNLWQEYSPVFDLATIRELSELGIIMLLFFAGLDFDLRKLGRSAGPAILAVVLQTIVLVQLAYLLGPLFGWSTLTSLVAGFILAISSTMATLKVLRESGRESQPHGQYAIATTIAEDFLTIALLVVLSGVAAGRKWEWSAAWLTFFLVAAFVITLFYFGRLLAPWIARRLAVWGDEEVTTLFSLGLTLGICLLSVRLEFPPALGAFLAGAILSQTTLAKTIEQSQRSIRDLFGAVFFVSFGMLIEPGVIIENAFWIVLLASLVIIAKLTSCSLAFFLGGSDPRTAFRAAAAKLTVGEFGFAVAGLGASLGVVDHRLTSLMVGVAAVTILAQPFWENRSEAIYLSLARRIPRTLVQAGRFYRQFLGEAIDRLGRLRMLKLARRPLSQMLFYSLLLAGLVLGLSALADRAGRAAWIGGSANFSSLVVWLMGGPVLLPFFVAIMRNANVLVFMVTETVLGAAGARSILPGRLRNAVNLALAAFLVIPFGGFYMAVAAPYLPQGAALTLFLLLLVAAGAVFWRNLIRISSRLEYLFIESFTGGAQEDGERRRRAAIEEIARAYPWPVEAAVVEIAPTSQAAGRRIRELDLRARTGCTILAVCRGGHQHFDPHPETPLFPGDTILLLGADAALVQAREWLAEALMPPVRRGLSGGFRLHRVLLGSGCEWLRLTLREADFRTRFGLNIVGIQRGEERLISPQAGEILQQGDLLLVVGDPSHLARQPGVTVEASPSSVEA